MEFFLVPLIGLGALYTVSNQETKRELFLNRQKQRTEQELLPNTDVADVNYPNGGLPELSDTSSKLSVMNAYEGGGAYTDKYFATPQNDSGPEIMQKQGDAGMAYTSLNGEQVAMDYFRHNNMTPFFGSKSHELNASHAHESTLDNYTGSGSQHRVKQEQAPLFRPGENYQWANGMPNATDFVQSRMNPSMRMANVKPFEDVKVAPGLGLGYTSEGFGGFNSGLFARDQYREKSVDELRVANKPKASGLGLYGHEGPASSMVKSMGTPGLVEKNRVDTTFELGPDRLFTTTGVEKGPTLRPTTVERMVNRPETTAEYAGSAGFHIPSEYVMGEYAPSHHREWAPLPPLPASAVGKGGVTDQALQSQRNAELPNHRSTVNQDNYFGIIGGAMGEVVAPLMDMLRPSRKETTISSLRPYQLAKGHVQQSYVFNPNDVLSTTNRQTTEKAKQHWNINANQRGGAYLSTEYQPADTAARQETHVPYSGNAASGWKEIRPYDDAYRQRNNDIKSSTIDGRMVPGNMKLMNSGIQQTTKTQREDMMANRRAVAGVQYTTSPSAATMGQVQGVTELYSGQQLDRNNGDVLSQLKKNPFL